MSSNSDGNWPDYVNGNSFNDDPVPYVPGMDESRFYWTPLFWGIVTGLAGSALVPLSALLSGALIVAGYGLTTFALAGSERRFVRSLAIGFALAAFSGAGLFAAYIYAPEATWNFIVKAGNRHLLFPSFTLMPWVLGVFTYILALIARR
jgi:hypothetical protein